MSLIYRYLSFESFIDIILRQKLTFIHPSLWDDPYELYHVRKKIENNLKKSNDITGSSSIGAILEEVILNKLYLQSWTTLAESDALWRIYSHGNTSVRIAIDDSKVNLLDDVQLVKVNYRDRINYNKIEKEEDKFYKLICTKRKSFAHEKEVRLIKHYKYSGSEDAEKHVVAFLALHGKNNQYFSKFKEEEFGAEIQKLRKFINQNIIQKTISISFENIDNFIDSVVLNPFAPEWLDETLKLYCQKNDLNYLGKSKLYKSEE